MEIRRRELFTSVTTEGAILPADLLQRVAEGDRELPGLSPDAYHLSGEKLGEAISRAWNRMLAAWATFETARETMPETDVGTSLTREKWLLPLFQELGYGRLAAGRALEIEGKAYPVSHVWQGVTIHLVGCRIDLDRRTPGAAGAARMSPHGLVQELLNRSRAHIWGFVSNGLRLRILRDNVSLTRQAYVEFDLEAMMRGEVYADFALLWLLCHESRVEAERQEECWLERWSRAAAERGTRALDDLRTGVEEAISALGRGLLAHPRNRALRERLQSGELTPQDYYRQLLRIVYRLLFLFVTEDRGLLLDPRAEPQARERYALYYSTSRLRRLAERRRGTAHSDLFRALQLVMEALDNGCPALALPALGSFLWSRDAVADVVACEITNRDLLDALRALAFTVDGDARRPVDYRNLGSEELGSVYESLLELHAEVNVPAAQFDLVHGGKERRATGSHYTPTNILRTVLDFALDPAIETAVRSPNPEAALLALRVLDPACGSGHFLVAAAHRIARALARVRTGDMEPAPEALRAALRDVVGRCHYGVDVNPMAVELCKVALWMETIEPGKPLTFLEYRIQCGDSLLGVPVPATVERMRAEIIASRSKLTGGITEVERSLNRLAPRSEEAQALSKKLQELRKAQKNVTYDTWPDHIPDEAFKAGTGDEKDDAREALRQHRDEKKSRMGDLFSGAPALPPDVAATFGSIVASANDRIQDVREKERRLRQALDDPAYDRARLSADAWCAAFFWRHGSGARAAPTEAILHQLRADPGRVDPGIVAEVHRVRGVRRFFHFELAFPEVFSGDRPGFDVVVGNPPYLGGLKISTNHGDKYLNFVKTGADEAGATTDLCAYFFRRGFDLLRHGGHLGFLGTNTIAQGDTRASALVPITSSWGGTIVDAVRSMPWEGIANLEVAIVHLHKGDWRGKPTLDGREVRVVTPMLGDGTASGSEPVPLSANADLSFQGSIVLGMGFVLTPEEAQALIARDAKNRDCLFPYLNGEDLNSRPDHSPRRWAINFFDWPLERVPRDEWNGANESARRDFERAGRASPDRPGQVAADYPELLAIVREKVKPERDEKKNDNATAADRALHWWHYGRRTPALYHAIAGLPRVSVGPRVSKFPLFVLAKTGPVFSERTVCVASSSAAVFAALSSAIHLAWALRPGFSTLETRFLYTPSDSFETFPFPKPDGRRVADLGTIGENWHHLRAETCGRRQLGLTKLYNLFHDPATECDDAPVQRQPPPFDDIRRLRALHIEMDHTVLAAYGWTDIDLRHGFYTGRDAGTGVAEDEVRFTIHPEARGEILRRLFALNNERAAEEKERLERGQTIVSAFAGLEMPVPVAQPRILTPPPAEAVVLPFRRVRPRREDRYKTSVPLLSLKAAAGGFSGEQAVEFEDWVEIETSHKLRKGMFVAQVVGESMEPRIPNGSYCLFRYPVVGSRQGRVVLVQHRDVVDPETGGSYTLKVYESEKVADGEGSWRHSRVRLLPINREYNPIELENVEDNDIAVIAEFIEVLEATAQMGLAALGDGEWAVPPGVSEENVALFALLDVMHALGSPADPQRVRLAALLVRRPALALPFMDTETRAHWLRVIGNEARPLPANVIPLSRFQQNAVDRSWADAVKQVKGSVKLVEDKATAQLPTSGQPWVDGRAKVVVEILGEIELAKAEQNLVAFVKDVEHGTAGQAVS